MSGDLGSPGENRAQRVNRELIELLNEVRVALPGVQVLLAFLLSVPFTQRFTRITSHERAIYYVTVLLAMASTVMLITPSAYHRLNFRRRRKDRILFVANRMVIVGIGFLALALTGVVVLISSVLYGTGAAVAAGTFAGVTMAWFWYGLPLSQRWSQDVGDEDGEPLPVEPSRPES